MSVNQQNLVRAVERIKAGGGVVLIERAKDSDIVRYRSTDGHIISRNVVSRLLSVGSLVPAADGLLEGFDQTLRYRER